MILLALALAVGASSIAPVRPTHQLTAWGAWQAESCGQWVSDFAANRDHGPGGAWVAGYLTRAAVAQDADILGNTDFGGAIAWLDGWCTRHPLEQVRQAIEALEVELTTRARAAGSVR